jgi:hypothetical protein
LNSLESFSSCVEFGFSSFSSGISNKTIMGGTLDEMENSFPQQGQWYLNERLGKLIIVETYVIEYFPPHRLQQVIYSVTE